MKRFLALACLFAMFTVQGCSDEGTPALDKGGEDPPVEQQRDWMKESKERGQVKQELPDSE